MFTNLAALTAAMAVTASAFDCSGPYFSFYNRGGEAMSYQRLDPALFPGTESPHLHSFDGGNGLAASMGFQNTQSSTCTSARIKPDKSLYWRPTLFWNGNNTGFYRVPNKFLKVYYKFGDSGNVRANVTEFPENFKMIAGDPFKRSDGVNPGGVKWACLQENYKRIDATGFPTGFTSCKEGLTSEITFPACWNGKEIDPKNPSAHMAWPTNSGKGLEACPSTHRQARFPSIFIEFWYDVSAFDGHYSATGPSPWVLSNGDPTGYGFHADFMNGWEKGVLAKATAETGYCNCGCGCGDEQMKQCFGADNVNDNNDAAFKSCSATPAFSGEDKSPIDKLPGCNPIQAGPAEATQATGAGCIATPSASNSKIQPSSAASSTSSRSSASAKAEDASSTLPSLSVTVPNKQGDSNHGSTKTGSTVITHPAITSSSQHAFSTYSPSFVSDGGSLGLAFSDIATKPQSSNFATKTDRLPPLSLVSSANSAQSSVPAQGDGECKAPVYVTITPTVYVTARATANATCTANTVYTTVTNTATVTVSAPSGSSQHKKHVQFHKY